MKDIQFCGRSLEVLRGFPAMAKREIGYHWTGFNMGGPRQIGNPSHRLVRVPVRFESCMMAGIE